MQAALYTAKNFKPTACITGLNNVVLPTLFMSCQQYEDTAEPESGVAMLNNTVDNCKQCGQHNCFEPHCSMLCIFVV